MALTPKQEAFCRAYIETGNASEAYRRAYDAKGMKLESVHRKAAEVFANGKVTARIAELHAELREDYRITAQTLLRELEHARCVAMERGNAQAMVAATMGKAKLAGLDKPGAEQADPEATARRVREFVAMIDATTFVS
ncbi:terminase small subunit [Rudaea sp.]|uniref:terminase small subunit n=1 Tax=Rudaea sp. TaxID=2136325 RepID=UPI00378308FA